jgi:hypothetical protein
MSRYSSRSRSRSYYGFPPYVPVAERRATMPNVNCQSPTCNADYTTALELEIGTLAYFLCTLAPGEIKTAETKQQNPRIKC